MTLHLHIGAHKTASTHLQATLIRHGAQLREAGVQFEPPDIIRAQIKSGRRAAAAMGCIPSIRRAGAARRLVGLDTGARRFVISDENSLGLCAEIFAKKRLYPTARRQLLVWRRLVDRRETVVYLSIREYGAFFSGAYVQSIRSAAIHRPDARSLTALARLPRRWTDIVADIRQALPDARLRVWRFEDHEALIQRLLEEMTGQTLSPVNRRPMATPSQAAVEAYRSAPAQGERALSQLAMDHPITDDNPKFALWSPERQAALYAMYGEDVAALRNDLGEDFLRV